ncbi:hypothetical protein ACH5RR_029940 [Cinchona calisaya]|uniref:Pectinesterase inhibitor domain-containing protein n=1 Tax=Cinchona calisaya TaxID=153742 RepID=A0ABD2YT49_9GENT
MAFSLSSGNIDMFLFASLSLSFLYPTKSDLVADICFRSTIDPQYCIQALRSDPRSPTADLPTLAKISIDLAQTTTKSIAILVQSLMQRANETKLKEIYDSCLENYNDTFDNLNDCINYLNKKDYESLNIYASAALDGPDTCDDNLNDQSPAAEPDELKQASKHVQELASAVCAIASKLQGKI